MKPSICITSVGTRNHYVRYLDRLETSLRRHAIGVTRLLFRDCWPPKSPPHQTSHYEFKAHAMKAVYWAGFDIAIWLDAACEVLGNLFPILQRIEETGYYLTAGNEPLGEWISDQALEKYGVTRDQAMDLKLCGGAIVGIDFRRPDILGWPFLQEWLKLAEAGLFYTSHSEFAPDKMTSLRVSDGPKKEIHSIDPRFKGHRSDEACFSLMLHKRGLKPVSIYEHFCQLESKNPRAIIKTGYDLPDNYSDLRKCICGAETRVCFVSNGTHHPACLKCAGEMEAIK